MPRALVPFVAALVAAQAAASAPFEIVESDATYVRVAFTLGDVRYEPVTIDGVTHHEIVAKGSNGPTDGTPGAPELPVFTTRIAVPPGHGATVTIVESETRSEPGIRPRPIPEQWIEPAEEAGGIATPRARFVPDASTYAERARSPAPVASAGARTRVRNLTVVPVSVAPFRPTLSGVVVATRVVVDVTFAPLRDADLTSLVPVRRDPGGEKMYGRLVLNAEQSKGWRVRKATPIAPSLRTRALRRGGSPEAKLTIDANRNELVRVRRSRLVAAGWTETPPIGDLRLTTRDYDASALDEGGDPFVETPIGILVEDENDNGIFDGSDSFVFYAQDAKTQRGWEAPEDRYSWDNVYWVSAVPGAGTEMPVRAWTPAGTVDAEPESYEHWKHYEEQNAYYFYTFEEESGAGSTAGSRRQKVDHLFTVDWVRDYDASWGGPGQAIARVPFEIRDPFPGTGLGARASWRSVQTDGGTSVFRPAIYPGTDASSGTHLTATDLTVGDLGAVQLDSGGLTLPPSLAVDGVHELVTERNNDKHVTLDWFEIGYLRRYVAHEDRLLFTNGGATGRVRWTVTGFTAADVIVLDLADANMPARLDPTTSESGSVAATFEDDVALSETRTYLAQRLASVSLLETEKIVLDTPSALGDLLSPGVINADYLVVAYDDFVAPLQPLIDHRRAHGLTPFVAAISDVYDEFSGGLFRPDAIREFVRYCYRLHPGVGGVQPLHLLLVGDASEDYFQVSPNAAPNYVPTYTIIGLATDRGTSKPLIATDHWYVADPEASDPSDEDITTPMMVGRLSVGSVTETENVVSKILRYEDDYEPDGDVALQAWRRRGLAVSDDCYSGGLGTTGGSSYSGSGQEGLVFEPTSLRAAETIEDSGLVDFHVETFFLSDILDTIPELGRSGTCSGTPTCNWTCTRQYARNVLNLDGMFISRANAGHLWVTYQGHGNRNLVSHEYVFMGNGGVGSSVWGPADGNVADVERLTNIERWPIWFFFACHVAEIGRRDEADSRIGDCLAERLVLHPEAGGIASVASTGFEWLHDNVPIHEAVFRGWFAEPHLADEVGNEPGMLLGEIMYGAKVDLLTRPLARPGLAESYLTLGDPALRIDIAPPRFQVWQDQGETPWDDPGAPDPFEPGDRLRASSAEATSAHFAARIVDEVPIEAGDVAIHRREDGVSTVIDRASYTLTPGPADPYGRVRSYTLGYTAPLEATEFEYVFTATDYNRRTMELPLRASVDAAFHTVDAGRPPRPITQGAFVAADSRVRVVLESPVGLAGEEIAITLNGEPLDDVIATPMDGGGVAANGSAGKIALTRGAKRAFVWQLEAALSPSEVREGANTIGVRWPGGGEIESREITVTTTQGFALERFFAFPNPFEGETDVFYRVSRAADRARVRIYTLSGRLIRTLEQATPSPDLNRIHWDGRDDDGDAVANGVYFYQLELMGPDGTTTTDQGKLARVVGHKAVPAPPAP